VTVKIVRVQHVSIPIPAGGADDARAFYGGVLGLVEKRPPASLDASQLTWFDVGDDEHEIHCFVDPDFRNRSTAAHFCLEVDDLESMRRQITERGMAFDHEPAEIHNRPRSFIRDPFGNLIELTQINGRYQEA
jgi:catechol 2,3-dioxygenase-like lactoylglutathione lyase family enzyme